MRMRSYRSKKERERAFTLLELMTVIVILSVLASTALPLLSRYLRRTKITEVYINLRKMYDGELAYYMEDHTDSSGLLITKQFVITRIEPAWPPKKEKRPGDFRTGGWPLISFSTDGPVLYSYFTDAFPFPEPYPWFRPPEFNVTLDPPPPEVQLAFQVSAAGDIDGDGKFSRFERWAWREFGNSEVQAIPAIVSLDDFE